MSAAAGHERIGLFFVLFSEMEEALEKALAATFRLTDNPAAPILHEIDLAKKLTLLSAAVDGSQYASGAATQPEWRTNAKAVVDDVHKINNLRRELAHRRLHVGADAVVHVAARKKQSLTAEQFESWFNSMRNCTRALRGMVSELEGVGLLSETGIFSLRLKVTANGTVIPAASSEPL